MKLFNILSFLQRSKITQSIGEAKRLIEAKAVTVDGKLVTLETSVQPLAKGEHTLVTLASPVRRVTTAKGPSTRTMVPASSTVFEVL